MEEGDGEGNISYLVEKQRRKYLYMKRKNIEVQRLLRDL